LQRIIQEYLKKERIQLVMMRPGYSRVMDYLRGLGSIFRFLKPPVVPPVLLLHPSNLADR
jgi:hypothetical protein